MHVPIIATFAFLVGDQNWWLIAIVTLPVSIAIGWLFHRYVEEPSRRLAKRIGAAAKSARKPATTSPVVVSHPARVANHPDWSPELISASYSARSRVW